MSKFKKVRVWLAKKILGSIGLAYNLKFSKGIDLKTGSKNFSIANCFFEGPTDRVGVEKFDLDKVENG